MNLMRILVWMYTHIIVFAMHTDIGIRYIAIYRQLTKWFNKFIIIRWWYKTKTIMCIYLFFILLLLFYYILFWFYTKIRAKILRCRRVISYWLWIQWCRSWKRLLLLILPWYRGRSATYMSRWYRSKFVARSVFTCKNEVSS